MKKLWICAAALSALFLFASGAQAAEDTKVYNLRFASLYMEAHPTASDTFLPWIEELKKRSNGRLVVRYGNPGAFVNEKDVFTAAANGAVDFALGAVSLVPGKFPRLSVMELPTMVNSGEAGARTSLALLEQFPDIAQKELQGLKVMWIWSSASMVLDSKKPIMTLEDLAKEKTNVWALASANVIRKLGGNPIQTTPGDAYLAGQRGQTTSLLNAIAPLRSFKLDEVYKYSSDFSLYNSSMMCLMSEASWKRLPPDLQQILMDVSKDMGIKAGQSLDRTTTNEKVLMEAKGYSFYNLSPEEQARWRKALEPMYDEWLQDMKAKGIANAPEILKTAREMGAKYSAEVEARNNEQ